MTAAAALVRAHSETVSMYSRVEVTYGLLRHARWSHDIASVNEHH
jgi:hypothetical protein